MIFNVVLIVLLNIAYIQSNSGSALFFRYNKAKCWNQDDLCKLKARKAFEQLIPPLLPLEKVNSRYTKDVLRYFRRALSYVENDEDIHTSSLVKDALVDTIGGHMKSELLPTVRLAYYAGYIPYRNVRQLHNFFDEIKGYLNTKGLGWRTPKKSYLRTNLTVTKIQIGSGKFFDPCSSLITRRDSNSCIHLPPPKLDDSKEPSALALPFKNQGLVSLTSPSSENILLKYYTTASRCILNRSPETCRHSDFMAFNNELWQWMKNDLAPHLMDEKLYAAYGGALRIAAAVQNYGKGLVRRNLFSTEYKGEKWYPWSILTQSHVYVNSDWTPKLYISLVVVVAVIIYLLQICYNYVLGDVNPCQCKGVSRPPSVTNVQYATVESNFPSILPLQKSSPHHSAKTRAKSLPISKAVTSTSSIKTERVYDLNDNKEKFMKVVMSDEDSIASYDSREINDVDSESSESKDSTTPPKIDTTMAQLTIAKTNQSLPKKALSTSTGTRSNTYKEEQRTSESETDETSTSGSISESSITNNSISTSKSVSKRSKSFHNFLRSRRTISKMTIPTKAASSTELDVNSFTTPPS